MSGPPYPAARVVAATVHEHFAECRAAAREQGAEQLAPAPDVTSIEEIINAAFWASLRREEGVSPKISLAFLPPESAGHPLLFDHGLRLEPGVLAKLAPAVERAGIHLGVWRVHGELRVWGTTRAIPHSCFVLEVVEPGLLVVKRRRALASAKYANVAVLQGDQIKVIDEARDDAPECVPRLQPLLGFDASRSSSDPVNVVVQLAASMRAHRRGGSLLIVPHGSDAWRESMVHPISYSIVPPFSELAELLGQGGDEPTDPAWRAALRRAVDAVAGLTAVDGATVVSDRYEVLAFGAKIGRASTSQPVARVVTAEPIRGTASSIADPSQLGGTRHLSAAQFVHDQRDAVALVASQDGRFTVFAWSACEDAVRAHRVETLLV